MIKDTIYGKMLVCSIYKNFSGDKFFVGYIIPTKIKKIVIEKKKNVS